MASAKMNCTLRFDPEPVARAMYDLVDLAKELFDLIPDWHAEERQRLETGVHEIVDVLNLAIKMHRERQHKRRGKPARPPRSPAARSSPWSSLTPRQRQIATLIARGRAKKEIAQAIGRSKETVMHHVTDIYHRLDVCDRVALARMAFAERLRIIRHGRRLTRPAAGF